MSEVLLSYINGNYSWARDEFWGSTKQEMRDIMLEAATEWESDPVRLARFISIIFLP